MLDMHVDVFERGILDQLAGARSRPRPRQARRRSRAASARSRDALLRRASRHGRGWRRCLRATAACRSRSRHLSRASPRPGRRQSARPTSDWNCPCRLDALIVLLLASLAAAGCDRQKAEAPQAPAAEAPKRQGRRPQPARARRRPTTVFKDPDGRDVIARRVRGHAGAGQSVGDAGARRASRNCRRSTALASGAAEASWR